MNRIGITENRFGYADFSIFARGDWFFFTNTGIVKE